MNVTVVVKAPLKQLKRHTTPSTPSLFIHIINDNAMWKSFIRRDYPFLNLEVIEPFYDYNYLFIYRTLQNYSDFTYKESNAALVGMNELQKIIKEDDQYTFRYFLFINKDHELPIIQKTYTLMTYENFEIYSYLLVRYSIATIPNCHFSEIPCHISGVNSSLNHIQQAHKKFLLQQIKRSATESDITKIKQITMIINLYIEKYCKDIDNILLINNILQEKIMLAEKPAGMY